MNFSAPKRPTTVRYQVLVLLALAAVSAYLTRICISVSATTIEKELRIDHAEMGVIMSAFFLGYAWFQVPTGWLGKRFGARITMTVLSVAASLCCVWSGLAVGPGMLHWSRVGLGVMQAGLVPCSGRAVLDWFPLAARGQASSAITSCMSFGAVLATGLTTRLLGPLGWRGVFFAYSAIGVLWAIGFFAWFRDLPEQHPATNSREQELIQEGRQPEPEAPDPDHVPWQTRLWNTLRLFQAMSLSSSAWMLCGQAVFRAFVAAFFLTWFPAFLEKGHGVKLADTGVFAMLPLAGSVLGSLVGGAVVDRVLRRTASRRWSRCGTAAITMVITAICQILATLAPNPTIMVLLLSLGSFLFSFSSPASWAVTMDVSGRHTQFLFGFANMAGNIGAMACAAGTGRLFDHIEKTGMDWNVVLYMFAGTSLIAALCWACLNPERPACELPVRTGKPAARSA